MEGTACEKCGGTGKIRKPVTHREMGEFPCDVCEGTGRMPVDLDMAIIERLDTIIELLKEMKCRY